MPGEALSWLEQEARALLTRLERVRSFALQETMVPAAMLSAEAQAAIEHSLAGGRRRLHRLVREYLRWLRENPEVAPARAQRRFTLLRLHFNAVLTGFDLFADAVTQRSEHGTGVWLSGLDVVAADALRLPVEAYPPPPVVCYLDRGHGAAIRRARTRLPGGGENPVAVIRIPRERMVGSGVASSLVHEVGHQGAALLGLLPSLRPLLAGMRAGAGGPHAVAWRCWERWISEIVADFWAVATLGVGATLGLIGVVSLPPAFVFRFTLAGPHPFPWIRVKLSLGLGRALYPDPQWDALERVWEQLYPRTRLGPGLQRLLRDLEAGIPPLVTLLVHHRPARLGGRSLREVLAPPERSPAALRAHGGALLRQASPHALPPSLALAALGQARADGRLSPEQESRLLSWLLTEWALHSTLHPPGRGTVRPPAEPAPARPAAAR